MGLNSEMFRRGGLASRPGLRAAGVSSSSLDRALADGTLTRIRRGWYASAEAPESARIAVAAGGALSCRSALALMGVWTMPDSTVHVRVAAGSRPLRAGVRLHWSHAAVNAAVDDPERAIRELVRCADIRGAVVALDSALNRRLINQSALESVVSESPRGRRLLPLIDGRSESGLETLARLSLRRCRIQFRSQASIRGIGRVDFLIGDRLVLEVDGRRWHDFDDDRARDRALTTAGYVVIRASYTQVMDGWATVETQILELVRRREHLWRASHAKLGHSPRAYRAQAC